MYDSGLGVSKDAERAFDLIQKSARQGYARAQAELGAMHYLGRSVPKNDAEAIKWLTKAGEQGDTTAIALLTDACCLGLGAKYDHGACQYWQFKK